MVASLPRYMLLMEPETFSVSSLLHRLKQNSRDATQIIRAVRDSRYYADFVSSLQGQDARNFIELLDQALGSPHTDTDIFHEFRKICGRTGILPSSHVLTKKLVKCSEVPIAAGGFGDVWEGIYDRQRVAIKTLRAYSTGDMDKMTKKFCKEVVVWKRLSHPNIVPFMGVSASVYPLCMVSEWMSQGNVRRYVRLNPETNRFKLLMDVTNGLNYLHLNNVAHGDLKGDNILVDRTGSARLCDFGLIHTTHTLNAMTSASGVRGSMRWMAPELFHMGYSANGFDSYRPSESSDIYALAMVFIEIFTGNLPFHQCPNDAAVLFRIMNGSRPEKPEQALQLGLSDAMWEVVEMCWGADRDKRPSASFVLERLRQADPGISFLPQLAQFHPTSKEATRMLRFALTSGDDVLYQLHGQDARTFIEILDEALDSPHMDTDLFRKCLRALRMTCSRTGLFPSSYPFLREGISITGDLAYVSGRFADVWEGTYNDHNVAIKALRMKPVFNLKKLLKTRICGEAVAWKRLSHPNIVRFMGISSPLCTISEWMSNGNINTYLCLHPEKNRLKLLVDIARGLDYLHSFDIVHGNLKGSNVLINDVGVACLTDYGLAKITTETLNNSTSNPDTYLSTRWMAPELLDPDQICAETNMTSLASDIYALAMVVIEVFTGNIPFSEYRTEGVIVRVIAGKRPQKPARALHFGLSDAVWELVEMCWRQEREDRPTASFVLSSLSQASTGGSRSVATPEQTKPNTTSGLTQNSLCGNLSSEEGSTDKAKIVSHPQSGKNSDPQSSGLKRRFPSLLHSIRPITSDRQTSIDDHRIT